MTEHAPLMTIGKLAKALGLNSETIRYYQREGMIRQPAKGNNGYRYYSNEHLSRIIFIKKAQELGFSLAEIKELLELNTKPKLTCASVKQKTIAKIKEIDSKMADLQRMKSSLEKLSNACDASQDQIRQFKVQECFTIGLDCNCS
ncbi:MAG: heavy metal-responsive transcriptional regulator [Bacteriovorax sp.]|nr:heavy metal-responsive transcriptional regulator [Bacteriovorax sp.]